MLMSKLDVVFMNRLLTEDGALSNFRASTFGPIPDKNYITHEKQPEV